MGLLTFQQIIHSVLQVVVVEPKLSESPRVCNLMDILYLGNFMAKFLSDIIFS